MGYEMKMEGAFINNIRLAKLSKLKFSLKHLQLAIIALLGSGRVKRLSFISQLPPSWCWALQRRRRGVVGRHQPSVRPRQCSDRV